MITNSLVLSVVSVELLFFVKCRWLPPEAALVRRISQKHKDREEGESQNGFPYIDFTRCYADQYDNQPTVGKQREYARDEKDL